MSLFGTGRREGITAVVLIGVVTALAVCGIAMQGDVHFGDGVEIAALALGGMLAYRFLRAIGRSRYAGFLGGLGYALAPLFAGLAMRPRELWSAALAPLALEAAARCANPITRRHWLPWAGLAMALPFVAGATVIAFATAALAACWFVHTALVRDEDHRAPLVGLGGATAVAAVLAWQLVSLDPFAPLLKSFATPSALRVMAGYGPTPAAPVTTAAINALGPLLVWFAAFGLLRSQRLARPWIWCVPFALGAVAVALDTGAVQPSLPRSLERLATTAIASWLSLLAVLVLGTAGLDDFLDRPMRRRAAHAALFALTIALASALPMLEPGGPAASFWLPVGSLLLLALVSLSWHRLGVLRFKNLLTAAALATLLAPLCFGVDRSDAWNAAPLVERALQGQRDRWHELAARPLLDFVGLFGSLLACTLMWFLQFQRHRRSQNAAPTPIRAKAAIKKKAPPAQRS